VQGLLEVLALICKKNFCAKKQETLKPNLEDDYFA